MNRILSVNYRMCEVRMNIFIQSDGPSIFEACVLAPMCSNTELNLLWQWQRRFQEPVVRVHEARCWCYVCRFKKVPGPYGRPGWEALVPSGQSCCKEAWLARGWFCRWCGRDEATGSKQAARGIYGGLINSFYDCPDFCECGWELRAWGKFNLASCGSCWWVCSLQLNTWLCRLLGGGWSSIHELIWMFLIEAAQWGCDKQEAAATRNWLLARIRDYRRPSSGPASRCQRLSMLITDFIQPDFPPRPRPCPDRPTAPFSSWPAAYSFHRTS